MGTDRELLELAAKAAGLRIHGPRQAERDALQCADVGLWIVNETTCWNPLTDDGDNRRLQVKLCLGLVPIEDGGWACITWDHDEQVTLAAEFDPNRAVVRAAAEIGRQHG